MKKSLYIIFTLFFTVITVGVSISRHYSGDELYSIALYGEADSCCEVPMDCCDDESDVIQFRVDYLNTPQESLDHQEIILDLFSDIYSLELLSYDNDEDILRVIYPLDAHPPREQATYLAETQAYLL